ncbi:hypothetical protein FG05_35424 [Fusarium graminearum]|nr:hypothetical protein FG05_35424 [Fusarium graminearum]
MPLPDHDLGSVTTEAYKDCVE